MNDKKEHSSKTGLLKLTVVILIIIIGYSLYQQVPIQEINFFGIKIKLGTKEPTKTEHPQGESNVEIPGKYPEASTQRLTDADLMEKSAWDLQVMRNEIYARYGHKFKTTPMRNYFEEQSWYKARYEDVSSMLTDIEQANIKLIQKYEDKLGTKEPTKTEHPQGESNVGIPGKYPEASTQRLTDADLMGKSAWDLQVMRNEIYARYGHKFKTTPMRNYFEEQSWYKARYEDVSSMLTDIEQANIKLIQQYEKKYQ